jgi:hypothetical protein
VALRIDSYQEPIDPTGLHFGGARLSIDLLEVPNEPEQLQTDWERPWSDLELLETDPDLLALDSAVASVLAEQRASPMPENRVERYGHAIELEGLGEESGVAFLVAGPAAEEAGELRLEWLASLRGLLLQRAERRELAFGVDDLLDALAPESPNQLALDVGGTDVDLLEDAAKDLLLVRVAEAHELSVGGGRPHVIPDRVRST